MVEKVVNAPRNPTPRSHRAQWVSSRWRASHSSSTPSRNAPLTLIANVVNGNRPAGTGAARVSS